MKIFLVCSTGKSWMSTGYGHSLLAGDADRLLVSFVEFSKDPAQQLAVKTMQFPYAPEVNRDERALTEFGKGLLPLFANHRTELLDQE